MPKGKTVQMPKTTKLSKEERAELLSKAEGEKALQEQQQAVIQEAQEAITAVCDKFGVSLAIQAPELIQAVQFLPEAVQKSRITLTIKPPQEGENSK
jgi:hypothetical protein